MKRIINKLDITILFVFFIASANLIAQTNNWEDQEFKIARDDSLKSYGSEYEDQLGLNKKDRIGHQDIVINTSGYFNHVVALPFR